MNYIYKLKHINLFDRTFTNELPKSFHQKKKIIKSITNNKLVNSIEFGTLSKNYLDRITDIELYHYINKKYKIKPYFLIHNIETFYDIHYYNIKNISLNLSNFSNIYDIYNIINLSYGENKIYISCNNDTNDTIIKKIISCTKINVKYISINDNLGVLTLKDIKTILTSVLPLLKNKKLSINIPKFENELDNIEFFKLCISNNIYNFDITCNDLNHIKQIMI